MNNFTRLSLYWVYITSVKNAVYFWTFYTQLIEYEVIFTKSCHAKYAKIKTHVLLSQIRVFFLYTDQHGSTISLHEIVNSKSLSQALKYPVDR